MTDRDALFSLLDELARLLDGSNATAIEAETAAFSLRVTRGAASQAQPEMREAEAVAETDRLQRVHATTVGIFSTAKEWRKGDDVSRGTVLGAIQSLGHMADITAPADGRIEEVLVAAGAPVEYGQALFAIAIG